MAEKNVVLTEEQIQELKSLVDQTILEKYPDLIQMLFASESLDFDEKKYWMELFPVMSEEHVTKLREILENERKEMAKLDEEYAQGKKLFADATPIDRTAEIEEARKRREEEEAHQRKELSEEEELLSQLHNL